MSLSAPLFYSPKHDPQVDTGQIMDDRELEEGLRALGAELARKPSRAYRTWILKMDNGQPAFELSEFDVMFDEILDEVYGEADNTKD